MAAIEYARCTCGGNHGRVAVFTDRRGTRWCVEQWSARFSDCPACKAQRADGRCHNGCRECRTHGWHKGRSCAACAGPDISTTFDTYAVQPLIWTVLGAVALFGALLVVSGILLAFPFAEMTGRWFIDSGFPVIGWAIILPIPLVAALVVVGVSAIREVGK